MSRRNSIPLAATAFVGANLAMLPSERVLRSRGHGIVAFELAGSHDRTRQILDAWGPEGRAAARQSLLLDFGYMASYGWLTTLLAKRYGAPLALPALAVACDGIEGVSLLRVLTDPSGPDARRAQVAAITKFAALGATAIYAFQTRRTASATSAA